MKSEQVKWKQYGLMVKDTPDTLGGMLRIQIDKGPMTMCEAVAFCPNQEDADRIVKSLNCHDELLSACKAAHAMFCDSMFIWGKDDDKKVGHMTKAIAQAITKAEGNP